MRMKSLLVLSILLIACLSTVSNHISVVNAQDEDSSPAQASNDEQDKAKAELDKAATALEDALKKKPPDELSDSAKAFLLAVRTPSNIAGLHNTTEGLRSVLNELKKKPNYQQGERVTAAQEAIH